MRSPAHTVLWLVAFVFAFSLLVVLDGQARKAEPERDPVVKHVQLPSAALTLVSFGSESLVADYLWIDAIQYLGRTLAHHERRVIDNQIVEVGFAGDKVPVAAKNLYALVKRLTEVDPHFIYPYYVTSLFICDPHAMPDSGLYLLSEGVKNNPKDWFLRTLYGFQLFMTKYDLEGAKRQLDIAVQLPGVPDYVTHLRESLLTESRSELRGIFLKGALMRAETDMERRKILHQIDELRTEDARHSSSPYHSHSPALSMPPDSVDVQKPTHSMRPQTLSPGT